MIWGDQIHRELNFAASCHLPTYILQCTWNLVECFRGTFKLLLASAALRLGSAEKRECGSRVPPALLLLYGNRVKAVVERSHSGATQVQKWQRRTPESCPFILLDGLVMNWDRFPSGVVDSVQKPWQWHKDWVHLVCHQKGYLPDFSDFRFLFDCYYETAFSYLCSPVHWRQK